MATVVWLEVAAVAGLLAVVAAQRVHPSLALVGVAAVVAVVALVLAVPLGGLPLASRIARRLRFRGRRRRPITRGRTTGAPTRTGRLVGLLSVPPTDQVVVAVGPSRRGMVRVGGGSRVPLSSLVRRLQGSGIPHDSVSVLYDRGTGDTLEDRVLVVARVDPLAARDAIEVRGGGTEGLAATLSALAGHVVAAVEEAGLSADVLGPDEVAALETQAADLVGVDGASEQWRALATSRGTHRVLALTGLARDADLTTVPLAPGAGVGLRLRVTSDDEVQARGVVRVAADQPSAAASAASAAAATPGVTLRPATGLQRHGLLDSTVLGSPEPMGPTPDPWPDRWPLLELSGRDLDRMAPALTAGAAFGTTVTGAVVHLDIDGAQTRTVTVLGDGWLATGLVALLVSQGRRVIVATTRPVPWRALARQVGPGLVVVDAVAGETLPRATADVVVDDIANPLDPTVDLGLRRPGRALVVVRPSADTADPSLLHHGDLLLATATGLPADSRVELLGVPGAQWTRQIPGPDEVLAVERSGAVVVRPRFDAAP